MKNKAKRSFVTVVSGLPRSGTSMMMRAIEAGGIEPLVDHARKADEDNPKGYYEFEAVKKTKNDPSWLQQAPGRAVKMVYRLLADLPAEYEYRVVFMQRAMPEILASQKKMLLRNGKNADHVPEDQLAALFQAELKRCRQWLTCQPNFSVLYVNYADMINDPQTQAQRVNEFLGGELNLQAMVSCVDPTLYRNRSTAFPS